MISFFIQSMLSFNKCTSKLLVRGRAVGMSKPLAIAIDGPAAAGKSTVAKRVAKELGYTYIDTGAMYRALTLKALHANIELDEPQTLAHLLSNTKIELKQNNEEQLVLLDGVDVTLDIRSEIVTNSVSIVAKHKEIREQMVKLQQLLAKTDGVVMDGRDIGTYVLPNAELKFFLLASVEERAKRRHKENLQNGFDSNLTQLMKDIEQRDLLDTRREVGPLVKADDAIEIDTTAMTINEVVTVILDQINEQLSS